MPILIVLLTVGLIAVDQFIKFLVKTQLAPIGSVTVIDGLLQFTYVENRGAAFGFLENQRWFFIIMTAAVICLIFYLIISKRITHRLFLFASAFIIAGGIGNLIDRIFLGYVVDYISLSFFPPVCNFADYCVTAGAILLIIYVLFFSEKSEKISKENLTK